MNLTINVKFPYDGDISRNGVVIAVMFAIQEARRATGKRLDYTSVRADDSHIYIVNWLKKDDPAALLGHPENPEVAIIPSNYRQGVSTVEIPDWIFG